MHNIMHTCSTLSALIVRPIRLASVASTCLFPVVPFDWHCQTCSTKKCRMQACARHVLYLQVNRLCVNLTSPTYAACLAGYCWHCWQCWPVRNENSSGTSTAASTAASTVDVPPSLSNAGDRRSYLYTLKTLLSL